MYVKEIMASGNAQFSKRRRQLSEQKCWRRTNNVFPAVKLTTDSATVRILKNILKTVAIAAITLYCMAQNACSTANSALISVPMSPTLFRNFKSRIIHKFLSRHQCKKTVANFEGEVNFSWRFRNPMALCDTACSHSWMTRNLADKLKVRGHPIKVTVNGINSQETVNSELRLFQSTWNCPVYLAKITKSIT